LLKFTEVDTSALEDAARTRGVPLTVHRITDPEIANLYECKLVLVRPDGHVAWRQDEPPQENAPQDGALQNNSAPQGDALSIIDTVRGAGPRIAACRAIRYRSP